MPYKTSRSSEYESVAKLTGRIREKKKALENYQKEVDKMFGEGVIYRTVHRPVTRALYRLGKTLPFVGKYFGEREDRKKEELDPLNRIERELKGHVEETERVVMEISEITVAKRKEHEHLEQVYQSALNESWDETRLFDEVLRSSDITVDPSIKQLSAYLGEELKPEQKEQRRKEILGQMQAKLRLYEETEKLLKVVAEEGLEVYRFSVLQYDGFLTMKDQTKVARDAALHFPDSQDLSLYTKQFVLGLLDKSADSLGVVLDTLDEAYEHLIANEATAEEIQAIRERLAEKLKARLEVKEEVKPKQEVRVTSD